MFLRISSDFQAFPRFAGVAASSVEASRGPREIIGGIAGLGGSASAYPAPPLPNWDFVAECVAR